MKSFPLKSSAVLGSRVRPHTNLKNKERSWLVNSSNTCQNHLTSGESGSTPRYVVIERNVSTDISGFPHTVFSNSAPVNNDSKGTGTTW